jgi:hypothetical protein
MLEPIEMRVIIMRIQGNFVITLLKKLTTHGLTLFWQGSFLLFFVCYSVFLFDSDAFSLELDAKLSQVPPAGSIFYMEDQSGRLEISQVLKLENDTFAAFNESTPAFGFDKTVWLKFSLENRTGKLAVRYLEIAYPLINEIDLFIVDPNKNIISHRKTGHSFPFEHREVADPGFIFNLALEPNEIQAIYIRASSPGALDIPVKIWHTEDFHSKKQGFMVAQGFYYGCILIMVGYNFFLFSSTRAKSYLFYAFFGLSFAVFTSILRGFLFQFAYPESPEMTNILLPVAMATNIWVTMRFIISFLNLNTTSPKLFRVLNVYSHCLAALIVIGPIFPYSISIPLFTTLGTVDCVIGLTTGLREWKKGKREARYFISAWAVYGIGSILLSSAKFGFLPTNFLTTYIQQIGSVLDVLLLSFALADRLNTLKESNEKYIKALDDQINIIEQLVEEKTANISSILTHIKQGILIFGKDLRIDPHHSNYLEKIFETIDFKNETSVITLLECDNSLEKSEINDAVATLLQSFQRNASEFEQARSDLPSQMVIDINGNEKILELDWQAVGPVKQVCRKIMLVIKDITEVNTLILQNQMEFLNSEIRVHSLNEQMKPHFLFNCLNVIDNLIMESPTQASEAIGKLADLYRYILKGAKQHFWPLDDEVNLVVDALDLQKIRFQEKIEYSIEIDEQIEKAEVFVPCLMLHTLVENAVKHAVLENPDGGWIKIKILKANVGYEVKVIDTGPGEFVNLKSKKAGTGTGLENTRQRLFRIYGDKARFTVRLDSNGSEVNFWISGRKS